jgi:GNAT superfamily N-acetyltransferase
MKISARQITSEQDRQLAIAVLKETYKEEKRWIEEDDRLFDPAELDNDDVAWFVATHDDKPVGVVRVMFKLPLEIYEKYGFRQIGPGIDVREFIENNRIAEIGRMAVIPEYRRHKVIALSLMRDATRETIRRGFSHFVTDVFEGEKNSPYDFHTRILGFVPVATHDVGDLNCENRRITLVLDFKECYERLKTTKKKMFRIMTDNWTEDLHARMS